MALDIRWEFIVGILLIAIPILIILLELIERKVIKKDKVEKKKEDTRKKIYLKKLKKIDSSKGEKALEKINNLTKKFFNEFYGIENFQGYYALERYFKRIDKNPESEFCRKMNQHLYAGYSYLNGKEINKRNKELKQELKNLVISAPKIHTSKKKLSYIIKILGINKKKDNNKEDDSKNKEVQ